MKIISAYKDYYDYLTGVYGIDEKVVYERHLMKARIDSDWRTRKKTVVKERINHSFIFDDKEKHFYVAICGVNHLGLYREGKFYFNMEAYNILHPEEDPEKMSKWEKRWWSPRRETYPSATNLNVELDCPVVLYETDPVARYSRTEPTYFLNPKLAEWEFGKAVDPVDAYLAITQWLSREKIVASSQSDSEKILSHGFDLKKSFRHRK